MWGLGTGSPLMVFGERFCLERREHPLVPSTAALWWEGAPQEPHMTSSEAAWPLSAEHGGGEGCVCLQGQVETDQATSPPMASGSRMGTGTFG